MAAKSGAIVFSPVKYLNIYFDDSAGAKVRYDDGAGAGAATSTEFRPPFSGIINDVVIEAATGQTKTQINIDGKPVGTILLNLLHLAAVVNRPRVGVPFRANSKIEMIQLA